MEITPDGLNEPLHPQQATGGQVDAKPGQSDDEKTALFGVGQEMVQPDQDTKHMDSPLAAFDTEHSQHTVRYESHMDALSGSPSETQQTLIEDPDAAQEGPVSNASELPVIAGYEIMGVLGKGGMGIVYRAVQVSAKREVALKLILAAATSQPKVLQRFVVEAQAAARIEHPHVITIFEVNTQGRIPYFSMQLVRGVNLLSLSKQGATIEELARYIAQVARGVQAAHDLGILHRDLKPENILVDVAKRHAYISDFGLAKPADVETTLTQAGEVFGSPAYMSPEQIRDVARVQNASDIYSLGATLYRVITGKVPFDGKSIVTLFEQIQNDIPISPRIVNPGIPKDLETICWKCLEKDPAQRYPSMSALARDLEAFIEGEPIAARPISRLQRSIRWVRKHRMPFASGALALAALLVAAISVPLVLRSRAEGERYRLLQEKTAQALDRLDSATSDQLFDPRFISEMAALQSVDEESHQQLMGRLQQRQVSFISDSLEYPRLSIDTLSDIEGKIQRLSASTERQRLEERLAKRRTNWVITLDQTAPFREEHRVEFTLSNSKAPSYIDVTKEGMRLVVDDPATRMVKYRLESQQSLREQLTVTFDQGWQDSSKLGLFLGYRKDKDGNTHGWFVDLVVPPKSVDGDGSKIESFKQAAAAGIHCDLNLYEGEQLFASQTVSPIDLVESLLTMRIRREGDNISCYLNQLPPLSTDTVFSALQDGVGQPGVNWPVGVSLRSIVTERAEYVPGSQPLDEADRFYLVKDYKSALDAYGKIAESKVDDRIGDECRFKSALCRLQLGDMESATSAFRELLTQSQSVWAIRSSLQLLYLFQKRKDYPNTRGVITQMGTKFTPSEVRASSSLKLQQDISDLMSVNYLSSHWAQPKDHRERVQMTIEAYNLLGRPLNEKIEARAYQWATISTIDEAESSLKQVLDFADEILNDESAMSGNIVQIADDTAQLAFWCGQPDAVKPLLERARVRIEEKDKHRLHFIVMKQAQAAYCKGEYEEALRLCELRAQALKQLEAEGYRDEDVCNNAMLRGWALHHLGRQEDALAAWRDSYEANRQTHPAQITVAIMGSLCDGVTPEHAQLMFDKVSGTYKDEVGVKFFKQYVPMKLIASGARAMWQSDYGRAMSERLASGKCSLRCNTTGQLSVAMFYFLKQMTREEEASLDVSKAPEDVVIEEVCESIRLGFEQGRIGQADFIPLGLLYLGAGGFFGFPSFENAKAFNQEEKSVIGYCLARHFMRNKNWSDAKRAFKLAQKSRSTIIQDLCELHLKEIAE